MVDVAANHANIVRQIQEAAARSGRDFRDVKLLAASKSQPVQLLRAAIAQGVRLIGENYVQEAENKKRAIREPVEWHMIGHLQRNKVRSALDIFDVIESLDSIRLAVELNMQAKKKAKRVRTLIEVNLAGEQSKSGIAEHDLPDLLAHVGELSHLRVEGLMAVPPLKADPEEARVYFRQLRELRTKFLKLNIPNVDLKELSMGMTQDYTVAIEEGATIVRIGTALFGPREPRQI